MKDFFPITFDPPLSLTIVRHGQTTYNQCQLITGSRRDVSLTPKGRQQARILSQNLNGPFDLAISSTLPRAIDTLDILLESDLDVTDAATDPRLNERSMGVLEGQPYRRIPAYSNGDMDFAPTGGESYRELTHRILSFLKELEGGRILLITHVGPMRVMMGVFKQLGAVEMMAQSFGNTHPVATEVETLYWPPFL